MCAPLSPGNTARVETVERYPFKLRDSAKKAIILFVNAEVGFLGSVLCGKDRKRLFLSESTCWKMWL